MPFPITLTPHLRREPQELLEATKYYYRAKVGNETQAAFPVVLRQSLEDNLLRLVVPAGAAVAVAGMATFLSGSSSIGFLLGLLAAVIGRMAAGSSPMDYGIVAVTASHFVLIKLNEEMRLDSGKVIEKTDRSVILPKPRRRQAGVLSDALPFQQDGKRGWRYFNLTDRGTGYMSLLAELRNRV